MGGGGVGGCGVGGGGVGGGGVGGGGVGGGGQGGLVIFILISKILSLSDLDHTHKAPASRVPWNLVGLGVGVSAAFLLVVICCDIKVQIVPRMLHCGLDWPLA